MHIGVFDSGRGGELIAEGLARLLPDYEFTAVNDREHVPYGSRTNEEILALTSAAIEPLLSTCPIIVIACNTATMATINDLRTRFPGTLFIGTEPMIKPAGELSLSRRITVLATPLTLQSLRYRNLVSQFADGLTIDEPSAHHWAKAIEDGKTDSISFAEVAESVTNGSDTVILACTHYLALKDRLSMEFPSVNVLEPTNAIARQIERLVAASQ